MLYIISLKPYNKPDSLGNNIPYVSVVVPYSPNAINIMEQNNLTTRRAWKNELAAQHYRRDNIDLIDVLVEMAIEANDTEAEALIKAGKL
jgi:hypothetical protein